jgi:hypothetical protein
MTRCLTPAILLAALLSSVDVLHGQSFPGDFDNDKPRPRRLDASLSLGQLVSTDWSNLVVLGTLGGLIEHVLSRDLAFEPGTSLDLALTYWEGRSGLRVRAGWAHSCLAIGGTCGPVIITGDNETLTLREVNVDAYTLDIGGAISLVSPEPKHPLRPFVFFGAGALAYNLDEGVRFLLPSFIELGGAPGRIGLNPDGKVILIADASPFLVSVDQPGFELLFAGVLGLGSDLRIPLGDGSLGLRFEVADHISRSPLKYGWPASRTISTSPSAKWRMSASTSALYIMYG